MPKDLCFVDCETTGLDPHFHELIDVAAIRVSPDMTVLQRVHCFVMPQHPERASPEANALTGFSPEHWQTLSPSPLSLPDALDALSPALADAELIGQYVRFDEQFLRPAFLSLSRKPPWSPISHDLITLPLPFHQLLPSRRLPALCQAFNIPLPIPHSALCDVNATFEIARKLLQQYKHCAASILSLPTE